MVLVNRRSEAVTLLAEEILAEGGEAVAFVGDVSEPQTARELAEFAVRRFGRLTSWSTTSAGPTIRPLKPWTSTTGRKASGST